MLEIIIAFVAGVLTIASPCILPLLPIVLGVSVGQSSKSRPVFIVLGFVLIFSLAGVFISVVSTYFGLSSSVFRDIAIVVLAIFGLLMLWPKPFELLTEKLNSLFGVANRAAGQTKKNNLGGFILGMTLGLVWTPCAGPVLGSILTLIATQKSLWTSGALLLAYSIGAGVPMLVIAYGGQYISTKVRGLYKYTRTIQKVFGVIIILLALSIYFNYDTLLYAMLLNSSSSTNNSQNIADNNVAPSMGVDFKDYGPAPQIVGITNWINSQPLTMADLKGKVVLVDFWTYSCINCIRTLPYVTKWYDTYKDQGFVILGIHTPEFDFEKDNTNVANAVKRFGINYPVAQDNNYGTWNAYSNQYWPAEYLINQNGEIVYEHFAEGNYSTTEDAIRSLLGMNTPVALTPEGSLNQIGSPEMYFEPERLQYLDSHQSPSGDEANYTLPSQLSLNSFALGGHWKFVTDGAVTTQSDGVVDLKFHSANLYMVAQSNVPATLHISVDGIAQPDVVVTASQLYTLFTSQEYSDHTIEIKISSPGFEAFTFTFG